MRRLRVPIEERSRCVRCYYRHQEQRQKYARERVWKMKANPAYALTKQKYDAQRRAKARAWLAALREGKSCVICGENDQACLEWHHREPSTKSFSVANAVRAWRPKDEVLAEIKKCDLLCSNCHRRKHANTRIKSRHYDLSGIRMFSLEQYSKREPKLA